MGMFLAYLSQSESWTCGAASIGLEQCVREMAPPQAAASFVSQEEEVCVAHDLHRRGRVVRASNGFTAPPSGTCGSWREARTWRLAPSVLGLFVA